MNLVCLKPEWMFLQCGSSAKPWKKKNNTINLNVSFYFLWNILDEYTNRSCTYLNIHVTGCHCMSWVTSLILFKNSIVESDAGVDHWILYLTVVGSNPTLTGMWWLLHIFIFQAQVQNSIPRRSPSVVSN